MRRRRKVKQGGRQFGSGENEKREEVNKEKEVLEKNEVRQGSNK